MNESIPLWLLLVSYLFAGAIPSFVFWRLPHARGVWFAAATGTHLLLVNVFNRVVWPTLRPRPVGSPGLVPVDGKYQRGSRAELDAVLHWLHGNLYLSVGSSLVVIAVVCVIWRWSRNRRELGVHSADADEATRSS
jgi:hypothetical protein